MRRVLLRMTPIVALIALASRLEAAPPVLHEGKTIEDWVKQLYAKGEDRNRLAMSALGRARFLVDAAPRVVPALEQFLDYESTALIASWALTAYGPLARSADARLASSKRGGDAILVARLVIGKTDLEPLLSDLKEYWKGEKSQAFTEKDSTGLGLLNAVNQSGRLGQRGDAAVDFALEILADRDPRMGAYTQDIVRCCTHWGPLAAPLAGQVIPYLTDKEPVYRGVAAHACAWLRNLNKEQDRAFFKAAKGFASGPFALPVTHGVAVTKQHDDADAISFLRGRASSNDPAIAAWAHAGLARRLPPSEAAGLVSKFLTAIKSENAGARAGAADGLMVLAGTVPRETAGLTSLLEDPDARVRWRIAALLLQQEREQEAALREFARGIDGPDDQDRIAAFEAARDLGAKARGLAPVIREWKSVPFPWLRSQAARAYAAVGGE